MPATLVNTVNSTIKPNEHPYMNGAWTPVHAEYTATDMQVIGDIPKDIAGVYVRNSENPVHDPIGKYHLMARPSTATVLSVLKVLWLKRKPVTPFGLESRKTRKNRCGLAGGHRGP